MGQGLKDLLASERGTICLLLLLMSFVCVLIGKVSFQDWLTFAKWIVLALVVSKTVTGTVETVTAPTATGG